MAEEELHVNFDGESPTADLQNDSYTQRQGRDYYRQTPLETITVSVEGVEDTKLTYREARNLLMQNGPLRTYFRDYKMGCNANYRPRGGAQSAGFAPSCNSLPFKSADNYHGYSVEGCIRNLLERPVEDYTRQELLYKLNQSKYSWRQNVTRSSWRDPRLSRDRVVGERAPQRLRAEIEEGDSIKPIHTVANRTTQEGAREHRKNLNPEGPYLTKENRKRLGQIITNNINSLTQQQQPTFTFTGATLVENNDHWKQVRINYQEEDNDIPDGTNIQVEDEHNNMYNVLALPNTYDSSFNVILPNDASDIRGFTVSQSIVPKGNFNMGRNKFGSRRKHIISTGNANGTYGVPILLAHAGITRKDSTRSTISRNRAKKQRICNRLMNNNSRHGKEERDLRSCDNMANEEMYDSDLQYLNNGHLKNTRKYNFDEAMDIMMNPDTRFRTERTPFETIWQNENNTPYESRMNLIENEIIRILSQAKDEYDRITGTRLINYLQDYWPNAYTWSGVQQPSVGRSISFVISEQQSGSDSDSGFESVSSIESEDDELFGADDVDGLMNEDIEDESNWDIPTTTDPPITDVFNNEEAFPSLVMKNGGKLARRTLRKKKKASNKIKL